MEWMESIWNLPNLMDSIWNPCGMWGHSKDLRRRVGCGRNSGQ
jgi:hypothetical protein